MRISCVLLIGLAFIFSSCMQAQSVQQTKPPLVEGGALDCPDHLGLRQFHSDTVSYRGISIAIWADSHRDAQGCQQTAKLHVVQEGSIKDYNLPDAGNLQFSIVDFSADAKNTLLESDGSDSSDGREFRDTSVAIASLSDGSMQWRNAWDLFGWGNCDASVEVQGFTQAGNIVISAGISTQYGHEHPNCVPRSELFEVGADFSTRRLVLHKLNVKTHGAVGGASWRTCENDPDIVAACFIVHGRLSFWNGTPSARIWRIGTKRMLGVYDDILPGTLGLSLHGFDDAVFGDFYVCPFRRQRPSAMQFVCVESVKHVTHRKSD